MLSVLLLYHIRLSYFVCDVSLQLSDVIRMLPANIPGFRVEVVVALYSKVVDLQDFHRVLFALSYPERMAVRERLGWLNLCVNINVIALLYGGENV